MNKNQSCRLFDAMRRNPGIACGYSKDDKATIKGFWNQLTADLNSYGPPSKNVPEWKKVGFKILINYRIF